MWQDLDIHKKSELIKEYVRNGITNLSDMQALYDQSPQIEVPTSTFLNGQPKWKPRILGGTGAPRPQQLSLDDAISLATEGAFEQMSREGQDKEQM